jgi:DNA helicase-2/ATP-dependent DNA helicase PcrA
MDTQTEAQGEMVSIMTLHSAKGLEFDCVFLPGWEEGVFPHQRAMDESGTAGLEEERRLAYVGITRAKEKLWITHAANRRIYNQWQSSLPSRFLGELPPEHVEEMPGGVYSTAMPKGGRTLQNEIDAIMNTAHATPSTSLFPKGTRVFHQKFGYGKVKRAQGDHLTISFEKAGEKKVLADYVQKS